MEEAGVRASAPRSLVSSSARLLLVFRLLVP